MNLDVRVLEVDPIHRRIVLTVTDIPADQPPRPETPSKVHVEDGDLHGDERHVDIPHEASEPIEG